MSPSATFMHGLAIRGGIPVIFPQFGARGSGIRHGFARLRDWLPHPPRTGVSQVCLRLHEDNESLRIWPHRFEAGLEVRLLDDALSVSLTILNCGNEDFEFSAALHTYLRVADVGRATILGLGGHRYLDETRSGEQQIQGQALEIHGQVDRVYPDGPNSVILMDGDDAIRIHSEGFTDTVIWNPGGELAATMPDLGPGNHTHFVCVEAAVVARPIHLAPGATWRGTQTLIG